MYSTRTLKERVLDTSLVSIIRARRALILRMRSSLIRRMSFLRTSRTKMKLRIEISYPIIM